MKNKQKITLPGFGEGDFIELCYFDREKNKAVYLMDLPLGGHNVKWIFKSPFSIKEKECEKILPHLKGKVFAMAIEGRKTSSEKFAKQLFCEKLKVIFSALLSPSVTSKPLVDLVL